MSTSVSRCTLGDNGGLTNCTPTGGAFNSPAGIAINSTGSLAYVNDGARMTLCTIGATDGALGGCAATSAATPLAVATLGIEDNEVCVRAATGLYVCPINIDDTISSCGTTVAGIGVSGLAFFGSAAGGNSTAFVSTGGTTVLTCPVTADGSLAACTAQSDPTFAGPAGMALRLQ